MAVYNDLSAGKGLHVLCEDLCHQAAACNEGGKSQVKGKTQGQSEGAVCQRLFLQPLGGREHQGKLGNVHVKGLGQFRGHHLQSPDGQTGAEIKHGRDAQGLTDCPKLWTCQAGCLRGHEAAVFQAA